VRFDNPVIRRRSNNQSRILKYFDATRQEWNDWKWHTRHIIRDAQTLKSLIKLTHEEYEAIVLARKNRIPFGITPYYLSLMDYHPDRKTRLRRSCTGHPYVALCQKMIEMRSKNETSMDFMLERTHRPSKALRGDIP
jgi:lysine 2,3-aminomutase